MTDVLHVRDAVKSFGAVQALRGATFHVKEAETVGLLGPNGAGKTTLVRCIVGRLQLDQGTITRFGSTSDPRGTSSHIGLVPQEIALYDKLSTRENLQAFARLSGVPASHVNDRVDWALTWTGLEDRAHEPVRRFSGGMKRRLNIACGVLHRPRLILLDEPTVGVDPQSRERIYDMLQHLKNDGASIVLTTHHLDEAEARCDRIVIIDHGQVVAEGTLNELVANSVGFRKRVRIRIRKTSGGTVEGLSATGVMLEGAVEDPAVDLAPLLKRVQDAGHIIEDVDVRGPGLHNVFLALTGKELRE